MDSRNNFRYNDYLFSLENVKYKGWDVFDGLNSKFFQNTPFFQSKLSRLVWIQFFKWSPINFRKIVNVPQGYNAKGSALFIQGLVNFYKVSKDENILNNVYNLADIIISQKAKDRSYFCVGYNFYWESKAFSVPAFVPNIIVSSFVAQAFLDLYEIDNNQRWLRLATEIARFITKELVLYKSCDEICFGYVPDKTSRVHNANLMGATLLSRLFQLTNDNEYKHFAKKSINYTVKRQNKDGSWIYGEEKHWQWIDNFHTGFNLTAISLYQKYCKDYSFNESLKIGYQYHIKNHYTHNMIPKYYNNKTYPIDIHNFAQGIFTFIEFNEIQKANLLFDISVKTMYDISKNYFYYQRRRFYINRINYIRWSQAWMFSAIAKLYYTKNINK